MTSKSPVGDISVVTLIRTDTTLDHSQKAEKVWSVSAWEVRVKTMQNICGAFCSGKLMRLARICSDLLGCACICLAPLGYAVYFKNDVLEPRQAEVRDSKFACNRRGSRAARQEYWRLWEWATSSDSLLESILFAHPAILHLNVLWRRRFHD